MDNQYSEVPEIAFFNAPLRKRIFRTMSGDIDPIQIILGGIFLGLSLFGLFSIYFLFIDDNPPAEILSAYIEERPGVIQYEHENFVPVIAPGDIFYIHLELCRYTDVPAQISRLWTDGLIYNEPPDANQDTTLPMGCHVIHREYQVPNGLPDGVYMLVTTLEYQVNFLATRYVTYEVGPIIVHQEEQ